jgi:hypothetical protein
VNVQVKLADFGVALKLSDSKQSDLDVVGSPYWMAPEIIEMNGTTTHGLIKIEWIDHRPTPSEDTHPHIPLSLILPSPAPPDPAFSLVLRQAPRRRATSGAWGVRSWSC